MNVLICVSLYVAQAVTDNTALEESTKVLVIVEVSLSAPPLPLCMSPRRSRVCAYMHIALTNAYCVSLCVCHLIAHMCVLIFISPQRSFLPLLEDDETDTCDDVT